MQIWTEIERVAALRDAHPAIRFEGQTTTYRDLVQQVGQRAAFFASHGIRAGDRVGIFLPNVPDFAVAYHAIVSLGAVAVSVNVMSRPDEVRHIVSDAGAVAIVTSADLAPNLPATDLVPTLRHRFVDLPPDAGAGLAVPRPLDLLASAPAAILYTSGTTGKPKGAVLSHGNVVSNAHTARRVTGLTEGDVPICFVPLFHCFGQNVLLNATLFAGGTLALLRRFSVDDVLATVARERVTMVFAVPTAYIALLGDPRTREAIGGVRYSFSAAAILPRQVEEAWHAATGMHVHEGYGLTETSPFASYNHVRRWKAGSVGAPVEGIEMRVEDSEGRVLGDDEVGELCIRGPNVMTGYWGRPEETALAIRDGWFHSGDIGYRDAAGDYFIVDRVKDMINAAGFKVWPREVEEVLFAHAHVEEAAVVGHPDDYAGEVVKAFVIPKAGVTFDVDELLAHCRERLSAYKVPRHIEVVASIPKGATGKVLKKDLRR
jgi:long-chain acyl-CoA synthetase